MPNQRMYYVLWNGTVDGPFPLPGVRAVLASGRYGRGVRVRRDGVNEWLPAEHYEELLDASSAAALSEHELATLPESPRALTKPR